MPPKLLTLFTFRDRGNQQRDLPVGTLRELREESLWR